MSTAEDYLKNPTWVHRKKEMFTRMDLNKNGYLSLEDYELWVDNIDREVKPAPGLVAALRTRVKDFCSAMGIVRGKQLTEDQYLKGSAAMAVAEGGKHHRGEKTVIHRLNDVFYDIVDTNHDGCVTLDEWKTILKACNIEENAADETFKLLDKNKNGKIERNELSDAEFKFWCALDDPDSKGLFGDSFEK